MAAAPTSAYAARVEDRIRDAKATGLLPAAPLPTPQDQANWRKAGSPDLSFGIPSAAKPPNPQSDEGDIAFKYAPNDLTMQQLANLPTDPAALAKDLTRRIDAVTRPTPDRDRVLFFTAGELLRTPVTPGTRAALLEIMAGMRGAKLLGTMTDPIGRTGIGVTWPGKPSVYDRHGRPTGRHAGAYEVFVFDPATTQLLAILEDQPGSPKGSTTILASGWTDQIGRKP